MAIRTVRRLVPASELVDLGDDGDPHALVPVDCAVCTCCGEVGGPEARRLADARGRCPDCAAEARAALDAVAGHDADADDADEDLDDDADEGEQLAADPAFPAVCAARFDAWWTAVDAGRPGDRPVVPYPEDAPDLGDLDLWSTAAVGG